jgi:hypothetical protein
MSKLRFPNCTRFLYNLVVHVPKPGDYAIVSRRDFRDFERDEIYAVRVKKQILPSRVFEKEPGQLLLRSDRGQEDMDFINSEDGRAESLVVGKLAVAIRPLQYTVVKPGGRRSNRVDE